MYFYVKCLRANASRKTTLNCSSKHISSKEYKVKDATVQHGSVTIWRNSLCTLWIKSPLLSRECTERKPSFSRDYTPASQTEDVNSQSHKIPIPPPPWAPGAVGRAPTNSVYALFQLSFYAILISNHSRFGSISKGYQATSVKYYQGLIRMVICPWYYPFKVFMVGFIKKESEMGPGILDIVGKIVLYGVRFDILYNESSYEN